MTPKVISIGFAVPDRSYSQREIFDTLEYPSRFWPIFRDSGISKRHFWIPFNYNITWQEQCEQYEIGQSEMAKRVITMCLDGRDPKEIFCIASAGCCGYVCPGITQRIAKDVGFRPDAFHTNVWGHGCEGGYPALKRAYDFTKSTGKMSLALSVELCSCAYYPEPPGKPDPTNDFENLRANAIFGDGASAVLLGYDNDPRHPHIVDFESYFDPQYVDLLGFVWQNGRLKCRLSKQVPKVAPVVAGVAVKNILLRNNLSADDIGWWVIHPGGAAILNNTRDHLGLTEDKIALSREVLYMYGNCSSSSLGIVGKLLMSKEIRPGDRVLAVSLGAGLAAGATLFRFLG